MIRTLLLTAGFATLISPALSLEPLPTEVEQRFQAGVHAVVGCEGCHWEESDKIQRAKVPAVCGNCHPGAHEDYESSVHWDSGKSHAICTDCHGLHDILPVKSPESRSFRSLVCGNCHPGPMEELANGPHAAAFEQTAAMACASCHSNHAVLHPRVSVVEPACESCHARDTDAFALGILVGGQFDDLRARSAHAAGEIESAETQGIPTRQSLRVLSAASDQFTQARLIWHSLDADRIKERVDQSVDLYNRVQQLIVDHIGIQRTRKTWVWIVWSFILISVVLLHQKRKALETKDE